MSARVINIHDAKLKTVSVDIRAMTISDRQVTLAVFRQLFDEPLISDDGRLAGLPWGVVNYHPDGCGWDQNHQHIVWQKGNELRRAAVPVKLKWEGYSSRAANAYSESLVQNVIVCGKSPGDYFRHSSYNQKIAFSYGGLVVEGVISGKINDILNILNRNANGYFRDKAIKEMGEIECGDIKFRGSVLTIEIDDEKHRRATWEKSMKEISALPQLFVAV